MQLTADDFERIAEAIRRAEKKTSGEIVCVLARRSSDYAFVPPLWGAFVALASPWPMLLFTEISPREIFAAQIAIFIVATLVVSWGPARFLLTPRVVKRARAAREAIEQFFSRGVASTKGRTGVLIFVSCAERYARIVADEAIAAKISDDEWQAALDLLLADMRREKVADGFVAAIEECARLLARHAPPGASGDELPDKIYVV
ncbi:TPM domain-containing protein [Methylocystis sp. H62]|uniref:TPM domain-containing protein n=1 Tax=Methylocystis sp. H62 TaxID=2785789 RepID=UPI0018C290AD|nr:TPM domain-containing protein [Methylocystis sp. H62]MBG0795152.1 TPM domain-containing protein [Methylocystis sp. H62]